MGAPLTFLQPSSSSSRTKDQEDLAKILGVCANCQGRGAAVPTNRGTATCCFLLFFFFLWGGRELATISRRRQSPEICWGSTFLARPELGVLARGLRPPARPLRRHLAAFPPQTSLRERGRRRGDARQDSVGTRYPWGPSPPAALPIPSCFLWGLGGFGDTSGDPKTRQSAAMEAERPFHLVSPLLESLPLSRVAGTKVYMKLENVQPTGSFKIRGIGHFCQEVSVAGGGCGEV